MNCCHMRGPALLSLTLICGLVVAANLAVGQEAKTPPSESVKETQNERIILKLKHTDPAEMTKKIVKIFGELPAGCSIESTPSKKLLYLSGNLKWIKMTSAIVSLLEAQQKNENQNPQTQPTNVTRVLALQHSQAKQIEEVLGEIYRDLIAANSMRIAADPRTNSIIVSADQESLENLEAIVTRLDVVPKDEKQQSVVERAELKNLNSVEAIQQRDSAYPDLVLQILGENMVVMRGPRDQVEKYRNELQKLDAANAKPVYDVTLRVVWLVSSKLGSGVGTAVPQDLQEQVAKVSQKLDLGELRTAGQFMIQQRSLKGAEFQLTGTAKLQENCQIEIKGMVEMTNLADYARLSIYVQAKNGKQTICEMASNISATVGHPVILGMTPIDSQPSLFVVQIMEAEPSKP